MSICAHRDKASLPAETATNPEPASAPVLVQTTLTVAPKVFKTQAPMFKHSDAQVHMAIQYAYKKDGATNMAFKYASFPTLDGMVTYGERFPVDKPQCLFETAREGPIVAPYMDVDCTLDAPAPHLLVLIVTELVAFTQKHLGRTPREWRFPSGALCHVALPGWRFPGLPMWRFLLLRKRHIGPLNLRRFPNI